MSHLFAIITTDKPGHLDLRMSVRPAHLDYVKAVEQKVRFAGPFLSEGPEPQPNGSLIVIEAADLDEARAFAAADPYALAGLFADVQIRPLRGTIGSWLGG